MKMKESEKMKEKIIKDLKKQLTESRYQHTLLVAKEAKKLAHHYHIDEKKAYLAGLTHDIAKDFTEQEQKYWINKYNIDYKWITPEAEPMLHAEIGYYVAKEKYHLEEDICNAVRFHTIGNKNMDLLAKIIFIADKIARTKRPKELDKVAMLAYQNIDQALLTCLIKQKALLESQQKKLHKDTLVLLTELQKDR